MIPKQIVLILTIRFSAQN